MKARSSLSIYFIFIKALNHFYVDALTMETACTYNLLVTNSVHRDKHENNKHIISKLRKANEHRMHDSTRSVSIYELCNNHTHTHTHTASPVDDRFTNNLDELTASPVDDRFTNNLDELETMQHIIL